MAKKALLIGINKYRIPGADLRGCVNDVKNMKKALQEHYGFAAKDITTLLDWSATTAKMKASISALIAGGKKGDVLLLHYSGHGANVPDKNGDEADARDEILCPTDLDWKMPLDDDWLRKTIDKLKPGVSLTVVMDCCHSGTNTRQLAPPDAPIIDRYLPNPWDIMAAESGRKLTGKVRGTLRKSDPKKRKLDAIDAEMPELLITGCTDKQTSADAHIGGTFNGALTYCLVETIREAGGRLTYGELHERTKRRLRDEGFEQVPQLEGRKAGFDREFLSPVA